MHNLTNKLLTYVTFLAIGILTSCTSEETNTIQKISYGTSFGMCVGYCKHDVKITKSTITYNCSSWSNTEKPLSKTTQFTSEEWDAIRTKIDSAKFFNLDEIIGCPDCADGGAEWIEIELANNKKHKVIFEYLKEPEILNPVIKQLRELLAKNTCE